MQECACQSEIKCDRGQGKGRTGESINAKYRHWKQAREHHRAQEQDRHAGETGAYAPGSRSNGAFGDALFQGQCLCSLHMFFKFGAHQVHEFANGF